MHYQNLEKLKRLKLFGMARALEDLQRLADRGQLDFADQLALLIDREATDRANTALLSRLRQARLRQTEVPPLSWTPKHLCFRSPQCRRNVPHTRLSSGGS